MPGICYISNSFNLCNFPLRYEFKKEETITQKYLFPRPYFQLVRRDLNLSVCLLTTTLSGLFIVHSTYVGKCLSCVNTVLGAEVRIVSKAA